MAFSGSSRIALINLSVPALYKRSAISCESVKLITELEKFGGLPRADCAGAQHGADPMPRPPQGVTRFLCVAFAVGVSHYNDVAAD